MGEYYRPSSFQGVEKQRPRTIEEFTKVCSKPMQKNNLHPNNEYVVQKIVMILIIFKGIAIFFTQTATQTALIEIQSLNW